MGSSLLTHLASPPPPQRHREENNNDSNVGRCPGSWLLTLFWMFWIFGCFVFMWWEWNIYLSIYDDTWAVPLSCIWRIQNKDTEEGKEDPAKGAGFWKRPWAIWVLRQTLSSVCGTICLRVSVSWTLRLSSWQFLILFGNLVLDTPIILISWGSQ